MHIPTFGQVATIGMVFFAVTALAVPIAEPLEADLVERSADLATRGDGVSGFTNSVNALEQRNNKKKCKRTNKKGNCSDSDSDNDKKDKKKCKRNSKGNCSDSDDDNNKKDKKKCKRNSKGNCSDSDDDKKNSGKKNDDKKNDGKGNKGVYHRREVAAEFDLE